jgi:hypothetical protein
MKYYIYFVGTSNGQVIEAANMLSAKWLFAISHGLTSLARICATKKIPAEYR